MKKFLLTLAAVLGFASQAGSKTAITLDQITAPNSVGVMVSVPGRGWVQAQIDSTLTLNTATNPPTLSASPQGQPPTFVDAVTPTGTVDGINSVFTLPSAPNPPASLELSTNGLTYKSGLDYVLSGASVSFSAPPSAGSVLLASYRR